MYYHTATDSAVYTLGAGYYDYGPNNWLTDAYVSKVGLDESVHWSVQIHSYGLDISPWAISTTSNGEILVANRVVTGDMVASLISSESGPPRHSLPLMPRVALDVNFPNPCNGETTLPVWLVAPAQARLDLYDILGRCVYTLRDTPLPGGQSLVPLTLSAMPSGTYLCRLDALGETHTRRITIVR
jgi:hypothetical protein